MSRSSTSSSDRGRAARLAGRMLVFLIPLAAVAGLYEAALYRTGESWPVSRVISTLEREPEYLYARSLFSQQFNIYKQEMVKRRRPAILVLGSSRVMQIRDFVFHPLEAEFYNAGGLVQNIEDITVFARMVKAGELPRPRVLLLGLDPWWFKPDWSGGKTWLEGPGFRDEAYVPGAHVSVAQRLVRGRSFPWRALRTGTPGPSPYFGLPAVGGLALERGEGFRRDGSHQYSPGMLIEYVDNPCYIDRKDPPIIERIRQDSNVFTPPMVVDLELLRMLRDALADLRDQGIEVHVFIPPFADQCTRALEDSPTLGQWWRIFAGLVPRTLEEAGIPCGPPLPPSAYGMDDRFMVDGWHPGEVLASRVAVNVIRRAPAGSRLQDVDVKSVGARIADPATIPLSFGPLPPGAER